jgi:hypothetical protein
VGRVIKVNFYDGTNGGVMGVASVSEKEASDIKVAGVVRSQGRYWIIADSDSDNYLTLEAVGTAIYEFDNQKQREWHETLHD